MNDSLNHTPAEDILDILYHDSLALLKQLIATPSFSREEAGTATVLERFFSEKNIPVSRLKNNVWCTNQYFDESRPSILLNSHHDTVKPNPQYTRNPFLPTIENGKLYGLGSNDAGGPLVGLIAAFLYFYNEPGLKYNLVLAASAEEEISGKDGIELILPELGDQIEFAIVGEPTLTNLAIAEKGLLVLDCRSVGRAGHAARDEGENAIYKAMKDIEWFQTFRFPRVSPLLGPVKMNVTVIHSDNDAHNVIPAGCRFVVDVRVTDAYTLEEVLETIIRHVDCEVKPRSLRMRPSQIERNHPIVQAGIRQGKSTYGSPTTSDQALIPVPSLKCGPGDSARSHSADEFIYLNEIKEGIETYIGLLKQVL
jgi:acetylornithine deacetylase/succinyl-diaminopimelate desuccinylase-like protein